MIPPISSSGTPTPPARQREVIEQLQRDGVDFRGEVSVCGFKTGFTRSLKTPEVVDRIGSQAVLFCLPGLAAVPLKDFEALQEAAVFAGKLPDAQARKPELARNLLDLSERGFVADPLAAYNAILEPKPDAPLDESGAARLRAFVDTPAFRLEAAGLKFYQGERPVSGLAVFDQPELDLGEGRKIQRDRLPELEEMHQKLGEDALETWAVLEREPVSRALGRLRPEALEFAARRLQTPQEVFEQIPQVPERDFDHRSSERRERSLTPLMGSLLKRLCDFDETGPAARAALDVVEARSVGRYSLLLSILGSLSKGQTDPVQVLVSSVGRDAGMEPAAAALKALEGHPVLAELPAEQKLYPTTKWTVCRVLLDGKAQPGVRALEDVYWGREAAEDLKPVAEIFLRRQGNELGLAMIAGMEDGHSIRDVGTAFLRVKVPATREEEARLGAGALPGYVPAACAQALIDRLQPDCAGIVLQEGLPGGHAVLVEWAAHNAPDAQSLLALRDRFEIKEDSFRGGSDDYERRERARASLVPNQKAILRGMTRFSETRAAATMALELVTGEPSSATYAALQRTLKDVEASTPQELAALAGKLLALNGDPTTTRTALKHLEKFPELQPRIREIRDLTAGLKKAGVGAVASVWLQEGPATSPSQLVALGKKALEALDRRPWQERELDEVALPGVLFKRLGQHAETRTAGELGQSMLNEDRLRTKRFALSLLEVATEQTAQGLAPALLAYGADPNWAVEELKKLPGGQDNLAVWQDLSPGLKTNEVRREVARFLFARTPVDREEIAGLKQQLAEANKQDQRSGWTKEQSARITDRSAVLAAIDAGLSRLEVKRLVSAERSILVDETPTSVTVGASRIRKRP